MMPADHPIHDTPTHDTHIHDSHIDDPLLVGPDSAVRQPSPAKPRRRVTGLSIALTVLAVLGIVAIVLGLLIWVAS